MADPRHARRRRRPLSDVYVGDHPDSARAFVIDQFDLSPGAFDEKRPCSANTRRRTTAIYDAGFSDGSGLERRRGAAPTEMSVDEFKAWLKDGDQTKPAQNTEGRMSRPRRQLKLPQPAEPGRRVENRGDRKAPAAQFGPSSPSIAMTRRARSPAHAREGRRRSGSVHPSGGRPDRLRLWGREKGLRHIEAKRGFALSLIDSRRSCTTAQLLRRPEFKDRVYIVEKRRRSARVAAIRLDMTGEKVWLTAGSDEKGDCCPREGTANFPPRTASPHIPDATGARRKK